MESNSVHEAALCRHPFGFFRIASACVWLSLLGLSLSLWGCASPRSVPVPGASQRTARTTVAPPSSTQTAIAHVQSLPLYLQAQQACRRKDYAGAARLLQSLARQKDLNAQQSAFVQEQRALCLKDAGLPVPKLTPVAFHPASPAVSPSLSAPTASASARAAGSADCGPRALLLVCRQLGVTADLDRLRKQAGTTKEGTSLAGLETAAKALGIGAQGVQVSREALQEVDLPAIAYVNGNHFVAVLDRRGSGENTTFTVHDPNHPHEETLSAERLLRLCSGYLLLLKR